MTAYRLQKEADDRRSFSVHTMPDTMVGQLNQFNSNEERFRQSAFINRNRYSPYNEETVFGTRRADTNRKVQRLFTGDKMLVKMCGKIKLVRKEDVYTIISQVTPNIDEAMVHDRPRYFSDRNEKQFESDARKFQQRIVPKARFQLVESGVENYARKVSNMSTMQTANFVPEMHNNGYNTAPNTSAVNANSMQRLKSHPEQEKIIPVTQSYIHQNHSTTEQAGPFYTERPIISDNGTTNNSANRVSQNALVEEARKQARMYFIFHYRRCMNNISSQH